MSSDKVLTGARIFDGDRSHDQSGLLIKDGQIGGIMSLTSVPSDAERVELDGGLLAPGFVDLQVNGGGGVLFNDVPTVEAIATICEAHRSFGTTAVLPTLITDTPEITTAAIDAATTAVAKKIPGCLGLHLEGPHLSIEKKGAHDPALIRKMEDDDLEQLLAAKAKLPNLMVTLAPESVSNEQISRLAASGIVVSLGHSAASMESATGAREAGASCLTHLYNAMSPLIHREPGMVGAGLSSLGFHCGLIADGHHVDPQVIAISLAAKRGEGNIFLVSDSMSTIGTDLKSFELNGRTIHRDGGRLRLADGTLAGADLELSRAVRFMVNEVGISLEGALRMASVYPKRCLNNSSTDEGVVAGQAADVIHLDAEMNVTKVWQKGQQVSGEA
ncbi:MAG: N-acetylglucosamine-6-phosphate deacetylase [Pseudomonadota bacterium]